MILNSSRVTCPSRLHLVCSRLNPKVLLLAPTTAEASTMLTRSFSQVKGHANKLRAVSLKINCRRQPVHTAAHL